MRKRINKILWHGNELTEEGKAKAPALSSTGGDGTDGLNEGEIFINNADKDPAIFIRTDAGKVARVGGDGGSGYTRQEINEMLGLKVDTAFFSRLFGLMDADGNEIAVNDVSALASSIKAKFGLWTEEYLSALGRNEEAGGEVTGATTLGGLENVGSWADDTPSYDRIMVQVAGSSKWTGMRLSDVVGLDTNALREYLQANEYATKTWVAGELKGYATNESVETALKGKVDNAFLARLIGALNGDGEEIAINDLDTAIDSIKVKFGLWSESYISALGKNPSAGGEIAGVTELSKLSDVALGALSAGQSLVWNGSKWVNQLIETGLDTAALADYLTDNEYARKSDIDIRINDVVAGAPAAYDTLKEIADVLQGNVDSIGDILTVLGTKADKATTLSGYGITDAYTKTEADERYVNVTGDTMTGALDVESTLSVAVGITTPGYVQVGDGRIRWDAESGALYIERSDGTAIGFYTKGYVSSMGSNPDAGGEVSGVSSLAELSDVSLSGLSDGQILSYDVASGKWVNVAMLDGSASSWGDITGKPEVFPTDLAGVSDLHSSWDALLRAAPSAYVTRWPTAAEVGALTQSAADGRYALTTGTNASGTWPISISGNAATATNASALNGYDSSVFMRFYRASSVNANDILSRYPVIAEISDGSNMPTSNQWHQVMNWGSGDSSYAFQLANKYTTNDGLYFRHKIAGTWYGWHTLLDSSNYASLLDSRYVNVSGDTMTGLLTLKTESSHTGLKLSNTYLTAISGDVIFQNNNALRFGMDNWDYNTWAGLKYNHSSKYIYLGLADGSVFQANAAQSGGSILTPGISNIFVGNNTTNKVWHAGNDGSGSGLDADLLDGVQGTGYGRAYSSNYAWDNTTGAITTATFVSKLQALGAFNTPYWMVKSYWYFAGSYYITDTGVGTIHLAGATIEVLGGTGNYMIRVLTGPTSTNSGVTNAVFIYRNHGDGYSPNWKRIANTTDNVASATKLQTARNIFGKSFNGTADVAGQALVYGSYSAGTQKYINGGIQVREAGLVGVSQSAAEYAPSIGFHWSGRVGSSIILNSSAVFEFRNQSFTGYAPVTTGNLTASGNVLANGFYINNSRGRFFYDSPSNAVWLQGGSGIALNISNLNTALIPTMTVYASATHFLGGVYSDSYVSALGQNSSDIRLKTNIRDFNATSIIKRLHPKSFEWNAIAKSKFDVFKGTGTQYGLIAQDVKRVMPEWVENNLIGSGYMGIRYEKLIPVLLQGEIETIGRVETLENKVKRLQNENIQLKERIAMMERRNVA